MDNDKKKLIKLKNGIRLLVIPINTKLTNITLNILLGEGHEKKNEIELTHYLEHIMATFTSNKYKDSKLIKEELNKKGAYSNAYVNKYETKFFIEGLYKDIEYYIDLLSNTLNNFYIDKNIVNVEKNAVIQELNNVMSNPEYIFNLKIWKYMFNKYYYLYDTKKHINNIKKYNTDNLYDYFKEHVLLKNTLITVTCPLNKKQNTINLLKKYFNFKNNNNKNIINYPVLNYKTKNIKILYIKNNIIKDTNSILNIIVPKNIIFNSRNHLSLIILKEILFNFETGIFYKVLRRELGLIYNIDLYIFINIYDYKASYYSINSNILYTKLPDLIENIIKIFENINITDEDIINAKKKILIRNEYNKFINLNTYHSHYSQFILYNKPILEISEIMKLYQNISKKEIYKQLNDMKKDILNNSLFFYNSIKNMNNNIKNKNLPYKIKYINLN